MTPAGDPTAPKRSPNIWEFTDTYELENRSVDPERLIESAMRRVHDWAGADVLDIGCGSGFHLPRFAETARSVVGVEPHPPLVALARERVASLPSLPSLPHVEVVEVREGVAQSLPVADASIDVAHARWAYFFGPGCEPGLAELERVLRPGGTAFVIDNDATTSTFGSWFRREWPAYDPAGVERFWRRQGWSRERLVIGWRMSTREEFEAVTRIELSPAVADAVLAGHPGTSVDYAVSLRWRTY